MIDGRRICDRDDLSLGRGFVGRCSRLIPSCERVDSSALRFDDILSIRPQNRSLGAFVGNVVDQIETVAVVAELNVDVAVSRIDGQPVGAVLDDLNIGERLIRHVAKRNHPVIGFAVSVQEVVAADIGGNAVVDIRTADTDESARHSDSRSIIVIQTIIIVMYTAFYYDCSLPVADYVLDISVAETCHHELFRSAVLIDHAAYKTACETHLGASLSFVILRTYFAVERTAAGDVDVAYQAVVLHYTYRAS